jgi:hypothetical protein
VGLVAAEGKVPAPAGEVGSPAFKSVYGQLMAINPIGGGLSPRQEAALRDLDGIMVVAEHVLRGAPVGAGAHSTICALLMDAYAKGAASAPGTRP